MKQALLEIVVLFIIMGCGLVLGKRNLIDERMSNKMSTLVLSFTFPLLIISSMDREFDRSMFRNSVILVAFSAIICLVLLLIIELEVRLRKNPAGHHVRAALHHHVRQRQLYGNPGALRSLWCRRGILRGGNECGI